LSLHPHLAKGAEGAARLAARRIADVEGVDFIFPADVFPRHSSWYIFPLIGSSSVGYDTPRYADLSSVTSITIPV
jgi:hypothetical protein